MCVYVYIYTSIYIRANTMISNICKKRQINANERDVFQRCFGI